MASLSIHIDLLLVYYTWLMSLFYLKITISTPYSFVKGVGTDGDILRKIVDNVDLGTNKILRTKNKRWYGKDGKHTPYEVILLLTEFFIINFDYQMYSTRH